MSRRSCARPPFGWLVQRCEADDQLALRALAGMADMAAAARNPERVRLLWEVCQIPDFRKVMSETHARLLGEGFRHLTSGEERLPDDWVAGQLQRLHPLDRENDTLVTRPNRMRHWHYHTHPSH